MTLRVRVEGAGVAAWAAATLLARRGCEVSVDAGNGAPERIVVVPAMTISLIEECLGVAIDALAPSRWIAKRCVAWESREFTSMPARSLVCDAGALADAIRQKFFAELEAMPGPPDWSVCAKGRASGDTVVEAGIRRAVLGRLEKPDAFPENAMLIAAAPGGWIFAVVRPDGDLAVASVDPKVDCAAESVLRESVDFLWPGFGPRVHALGAGPAAPRYDRACATRRRIAVGDSALAPDPLRGDGVGFAVRGALLAQAVLGAVDGADLVEARLQHYRDRLYRVFFEHVRACVAHYEAAWNAPIWRREVALMRNILKDVPTSGEMRLRLIGTELMSA